MSIIITALLTIMLCVDYIIRTDSSGGTRNMPIYEYGCMKCGKTHEIMQKFSDTPLTVCPDCGGEVRKMISNTSFVLKGTGWYATDYASNKTTAKDKQTASTTETKTEDKAGESKTEIKSEPKKEEVAAK